MENIKYLKVFNVLFKNVQNFGASVVNFLL